VIAPANTGKDKRRRMAVKITDQTNSLIFSAERFFALRLIIVVIKFKAPKIEEIPARCKEKIVKSTEGPE
jgi:hypothetical protein